MNIVIDSKIVDDYQIALNKSIKALETVQQQYLAALDKYEADKLLDEQEACKYLRRGPDTIRYYRTLGLPYFKKGKDVWFTKADIDAWMKTGKVNQHRR